jgi:hypothetical protein
MELMRVYNEAQFTDSLFFRPTFSSPILSKGVEINSDTFVPTILVVSIFRYLQRRWTESHPHNVLRLLTQQTDRQTDRT